MSQKEAYQPLTFYATAASIMQADEYIELKKLDGWKVLVEPFIVDSKMVNTFRQSADGTSILKIASNLVETWGFILHRF